jgi:hypothetical protein
VACRVEAASAAAIFLASAAALFLASSLVGTPAAALASSLLRLATVAASSLVRAAPGASAISDIGKRATPPLLSSLAAASIWTGASALWLARISKAAGGGALVARSAGPETSSAAIAAMVVGKLADAAVR